MSGLNIGAAAVIDTSVALKFFITEDGSDKAAVLLRGLRAGTLQLSSPDLLLPEYANAVWTKTVEGLSAGDAAIIIEKMLALCGQLDIVASQELIRSAFTLSRKHSHPIYDCIFLALAEARDVPLVTADEKFYRKVQSHTEKILLLRDLAL